MNHRLRALLEGRNLAEIARLAGVPYHALYYFATHPGSHFNADYAEAVLRVLEGEEVEA